MRLSCGPQPEVENQLCSCWPTENFILSLWETYLFLYCARRFQVNVSLSLNMLLVIFFLSGLGTHTALAWVIWAHGEAFILDNLTISVGFGKLLFFAVAVGFSRGLGLVQAPCVTLLSAGLVSQSRSCCCDNYGIVKPNLIRADGFMAIARVVAGAARLQRLPLDRSGQATALLRCSMTQQYFVPLFVNLQSCLTEVLVFYKWRNIWNGTRAEWLT